MHEAQPPLELEAVFNKRGSDWTPREKGEVLRWIDTQRRYLRVSALSHLGRYATREEAEDVLQKFYLKKWEGVVRNYDPARKGNDRAEGGCPFWIYLLFCFKKFCLGERKGIVYPAEREVPLLRPEGDEGEPTVYEEGNEDLDPIAIEDERQFVKECLRRLKRKYREVVEMRHFRDMSPEEIAEELGISIGHARLKHHRALQELRKWMTKYLPRLGPKYREVVEMQQRHMSHKEIAKELGITETSAKVRLANAWRELLDCLREEGFA